MTRLSHIDNQGRAAMVDVAAKAVTRRSATAAAFVAMSPSTLALIREGTAAKGDVLATARIAGIMAAKRTHDLIPLCHPLAISKVAVAFDLSDQPCGVNVSATVSLAGQTGVEMEALTAVSIACLTLYDMLKAAEKGMRIEALRLVEKTGGKSGDWRAP
jgi:cyclic pyranopterin phosphate synthase